MSATNPNRVSDLIKRFGWTFMPYAAALGDRLYEAQVLFVDSGYTNALDADDEVHGTSWEMPLATIDYAIGLCTTNEQSIILVAPGHREDFDDTTTGFDADVAGIQIIGMGFGGLRPRLDFNHATSKCTFSADDVVMKNFVLRPSAATIAIGLDLESGIKGCIFEDIEFDIGDDQDGSEEFAKAIHLTSGNHDTVFRNVKIVAHASCDGATHGIHIDAASDRLTFDNVIIDGPYSAGGIIEDAAGVNHVCVNTAIDTSGTNFGFHGSSTFAKLTNNVDAGVDSEEAEALIEVTRGTGNYPTGITDNSILAYIMGKGATASASTFNNTTDSLEAIADAVAAYTDNVAAAVPEPPVANSLHDTLHKDGNYSFDNTTDSLEAIADSITAGTTFGAGVNLDHLQKTAVASGVDLTAEVADGTVLSNIMTSDGDTSGYDRTTDSLEAISDAVASITDSVTTAVSQSPTARSLQDILEKDGTGSFDDSTDSLEAIADRLIDANITLLTAVADGGTNPYPDSVVQESVVAYLMSKSANPVATSYNNTTDSLEAIRDNIDSGTGVLAGINVDHLQKTAVANGADMTTEVADGTVLSNIMTSDGDTSGYDRATDSLEAIADALAAGTGATVAIEADGLDHLCQLDGATQKYPENAVDDSILAKILVKSDPADISNYDNATDSLEAIADALAAGTGCTTAIEADGLDHLVVAADGGTHAYPDSVAQESIFAYILSKSANPVATSFDNTTDSLEAIADTVIAIAADSTYIADGALPAAPTANSLAAYIASGGTALGTELADSKSIVDAIGHTGSAPLTDGIGHWQEKTVKKTGAVADSDDLFTVASGAILIKSLIGVVTTQIGATQTRIKVVIDSTSGNDDRDFSTQVDLTGDTVGTIYVFSAANPAVLTPLTTGSNGGGNPQYPWYCPAGVIEQANADDLDTGAIDWYLTYVPLATGVTVVAA